jgi:hypothetical protein
MTDALLARAIVPSYIVNLGFFPVLPLADKVVTLF